MVVGIILAVGGGVCVGAVLGVAVIRPCVCQLDGHRTRTTHQSGPTTEPPSSGRMVWTTDQVEVMVEQARRDGKALGAMEARAMEAHLQAGRAVPTHVTTAATTAIEGGER